MDRRIAVATGVFDDDRYEAVADRIDRCRADTPRCRQTRNDGGVDARRPQLISKPGTEKCTGILFGNNLIAIVRGKSRREITQRVAPVKTTQRGDLLIKDPAVMRRIPGDIFDARENDRNTGRSGGVADISGNRADIFNPGIKGRGMIEIGAREIDQNECRACTKLKRTAKSRGGIIIAERRAVVGSVWLSHRSPFLHRESCYTSHDRVCIQNAMIEGVTIFEVGPRDGLQNESGIVATADKIALVGRAIAYGARRIEVASFANPRRVPQMADAEAAIAGLPDDPHVRYTGLCMNVRGIERAIATRAEARGIDEAGCVIVATDRFGIANQGQTVAQGLAANREMIALAKSAGMSAQVTIAASFGCPFEGAVPVARVIDIAEAMADAGATEIGFADTIGVGVPAQVHDMIDRAHDRLGTDFPLRVHFHDTRGMGPANAWAAYEAGCRTFDSALGGLGGCPFAPGAAGNVATEDLLYLFAHSGIDTGLDLDAALAASAWLGGVMGKPLPSRVGRAGNFNIIKEHETA